MKTPKPLNYYTLLIFQIFICLGLSGIVNAGERFFDIDSDRQKATVPFQLINNFIVIDALINDNPQKFIIDTGFATPILFDASTHPNLKIEDKSVQFSGAGQGHPVKGYWAMNVDIRLPGVYSDQVAMVAMERDDLAIDPHFKVDGAIGFQLFTSLVVHIDYEGLMIYFYRPEQFQPPNDFSSATLEIDYTKPFVYLQYQKGLGLDSARLLLDLGANLNIMLLKEGPWAQKAVITKKRTIIGYGLSGIIKGQKATIPDFTFAGLQQSEISIYLVNSLNYGQSKDLHQRQGSLGNKLLKDYEIIINYIDNKIYLRPYESKASLLARK